MSENAFRLLERFQKLDADLRRAQARQYADPCEIAMLKKLKLAIRARLARVVRKPVTLH